MQQTHLKLRPFLVTLALEYGTDDEAKDLAEQLTELADALEHIPARPDWPCELQVWSERSRVAFGFVGAWGTTALEAVAQAGEITKELLRTIDHGVSGCMEIETSPAWDTDTWERVLDARGGQL
jgi:hypothetical protein